MLQATQTTATAATESERDALLRTFQHVKVTLRPDGIHELTFLDPSKASIDEWYAYEVFVNAHNTTREIINQIFDFRKGLGPIKYFMQKSRELFAQIPDLHRHRAAVIYSNQNATIMFASLSLFNSLPMARGTTRYYFDAKYNEAVAWLLSNK